MNTADLYSRGTKLAEIPPDFRGIPWQEFANRQIAAQGERARAEWRRAHPGEDAPIMKQAIATGRDKYGHKSAGPLGNIATLKRED